MISDDAKNERSTIYQVLEQARASLIDPQRPTTPAESMRRSLFAGEDYRPESRPTSAFHLDGSSTSEAFHVNDDFKYDGRGGFLNGNESGVLNSNTGYGQSSQRRKKKKKKKKPKRGRGVDADGSNNESSRKENESSMMQRPASEWGWGEADSRDDTVEIMDNTNQPFKLTITKKGKGEAESGNRVEATDAKCEAVESDIFDNLESSLDNPASAEVACRFQNLNSLDTGLLSELDPSASPDILLLKLAAVEAAVSDLTMGGIDVSSYSMIGVDGKSIEETASRVRRHAMRALYKLMKVNTPRLQLCVAKLILRIAAAAAVQELQCGSVQGNSDDANRRHKQMVTALKLLFSLSKAKTHDKLFRKERILHTLLELLSGEAGEETKRRTRRISQGKPACVLS